jgi:signal transduction histidine kinase/Tfp pilus assembly protein PilF
VFNFRTYFVKLFFVVIYFFLVKEGKAVTQDSISIKLQQATALVYVNPALAETQLLEVLKSSEDSKEYITWCEAAKQLAILQINAGRFTQASNDLQKALQVSEQWNLQLYNAHFRYLLGNSYHAQGRFSIAVENYLAALRYFEFAKVETGLLNAYTSLADVYSRQSNFSKAIEFNLKAIKLFEQRKDRFRLLSSYEQVGLWYARQGQVKKAQDAYKKALNLYKELGNKAGIAATYINMGDLSYELNAYPLAIEQYSFANNLSNDLKIIPLQTRSLLGLAKSHAMLKDYVLAATEYRKVTNLAKEIGMKIELEEAYEGLAELYRSLNDKQTSKAYQSLSNEIKDSLFNDSILRRTSDLQLQYEAEKKQAEIEIFKKEGEIKAMQLRQTNQVKNFFIALSVLLVLLIFLFVYFISENRKINKQLKRGLTELEIKNQEILIQKEQLSQLNQVKDRFFSIISHDLRNNLTTMKLYFDLVSNPAYEASSQQEFGKEVAASVQNTIDLLENLLVWASGQIKGVRVEPKKVNLYALAEENIGMLKTMAIQKNIALHNETEHDAFLYADANMVNLILRNLLSNALKFTKEGGEVSILSEEFETYHQISVIDNGVGIEIQKLESLFTAHMNVSTQGTANEKGTGLGLMLCKDFTEKNGGKIWVESEAGKGSSFMLTFPKFQ